MTSNNSDLINDLFEINRRVSLSLWNVSDANGKPRGLSPRIIYPIYVDRRVRISEQEAKILYCSLLNTSSYYYSVETPTEQTYKQTGQTPMAARPDLTIYNFNGRSFERLVNIEFKAHQPSPEDIGRGIEKLVREQIQGNWFHTLKNTNRGTFPNLFRKFTSSLLSFSNIFSGMKISILFSFCILEKQQTYMRHFLYDPTKYKYEDYVHDFFDPSQQNLDNNWKVFSKELIGTRAAKNQGVTQGSGEKEEVDSSTPEPGKLEWERASMIEDCFDLRAQNLKRLNIDLFGELLDDVKRPKSDCRMNFSANASSKFKEWLDAPDQPLPEEAYAILNNWAFGKGPSYKGKSTQLAARDLWDALFCARPDDRLTDWKIKNGEKILPERFKLWRSKQLECQTNYYEKFVRLWEEGIGFSFDTSTKGGCAKHKGKARLWVFPEYFQIPSYKKTGNEFVDVICEIQRKYFSDIRGKARVYFNSPDFSWDKFKDFVIEVKDYLKTKDC